MRTVYKAHGRITGNTFQMITTQHIFIMLLISSDARLFKCAQISKQWEFVVLWASDYQSCHITIFTQADLLGCQMWLVYCPGFIAPPIFLITFWHCSNLKRFASETMALLHILLRTRVRCSFCLLGPLNMNRQVEWNDDISKWCLWLRSMADK